MQSQVGILVQSLVFTKTPKLSSITLVMSHGVELIKAELEGSVANCHEIPNIHKMHCIRTNAPFRVLYLLLSDEAGCEPKTDAAQTGHGSVSVSEAQMATTASKSSTDQMEIELIKLHYRAIACFVRKSQQRIL